MTIAEQVRNKYPEEGDRGRLEYMADKVSYAELVSDPLDEFCFEPTQMRGPHFVLVYIDGSELQLF